MVVHKDFLRAGLVALLVFAVAGCASIFGPSKPDPAAQMPALENSIVALVKAERARADPKARDLLVDPELTDVARKRSQEMAKANSFTTGSDPHASATMLMGVDAKFQGLVGENVAAQHYLPDQGVNADEFAKRFVESWLASKPHKENLSFADYDRTGVGAAVNGDTVYVTQLFTTDLGLGAKAGNQDNEVTPVETPEKGKEGTQSVPLRGAIVPGKTNE